MEDQISFNDQIKPALPSGLNVLTILTFVGSALALLSGIWSYISAEKSYENIQKAQENLANAPGWVKGMMGPDAVEMAKKTMENKLPILLLTLASAALCIYGAMEMRKLKKQGFILWLVGEVLPIVASVIFIGFGIFKGVTLFIMLFPVLFIILYAVNRKHLIY